MNTFLHTVLSDLIQRVGLEGLSHTTLVFPMQRAGLFAKQEIASYLSASIDSRDPSDPRDPRASRESRASSPIILPHFTTIDALADSLCTLRDEEELVSVCRLYEAYCQHIDTDPMPVDVFYGWGLQLLNDFSAVDMALVPMQQVLDNAATASLMDSDSLDEEVRQRLLTLLGEQGANKSIRHYFQSLWDKLPAIYDTFHRSQLADGVGSKGAKARWVIEHFDEVQDRLNHRTFVFIGFNYLLGAERRLMELIQAHTPTLFYWDYDPSFTLDASVYHFLRDDITHFGNCLPDAPSVYTPSAQRSMQALACQSSTAQSRYVHDWLLAHHRPGDKTAIVLADESMLQSVIYAIPDDYRVNITKGFPLRQTYIYARAIQLLEHLDETAPMDASLDSLAKQLEAEYKATATEERQSWQSILADEAYYRTQLVIRQLRVLLDRNDFIRRTLSSYKLLRSLLRRQLEMVSIPFHGEPVTDIQIIGVLETRLLDFNHVLILNVEEGVVPNTRVDHSFLPYDLRKAYGMQTRDEEAKIYAYNFFRLIRRPQDVTFTFSEATTEMGKKTLSRFLMQLLASPAYAVERYRLTELATCVPYALPDTQWQPSDQRPDHLSPSAINDYIECPREFYLKHIQHLHEPDQDTTMLSVSTFGTLVHETLSAVYQHHADPRQALEQAYRKYHLPIEQHEAENFVILKMVDQVIQRDQQYPVVQSIAYELDRHWDVDYGVGTVSLEGKIDRLDIVEEDGVHYLRVLDYKTGGYHAAKLKFDTWDELFSNHDKSYALQTLIYCALLLHDMPSATCNSPQGVQPQLLFLRALSADPHVQYANAPVTDYHLCAQPFEEALTAKIREIMTATSFPMADESVCQDSYCPFHLLCNREKNQ